jgi:hypothetical protein
VTVSTRKIVAATMPASNGNTSDRRTGADESCSMKRKPCVSQLMCSARAMLLGQYAPTRLSYLGIGARAARMNGEPSAERPLSVSTQNRNARRRKAGSRPHLARFQADRKYGRSASNGCRAVRCTTIGSAMHWMATEPTALYSIRWTDPVLPAALPSPPDDAGGFPAVVTLRPASAPRFSLWRNCRLVRAIRDKRLHDPARMIAEQSSASRSASDDIPGGCDGFAQH